MTNEEIVTTKEVVVTTTNATADTTAQAVDAVEKTLTVTKDVAADATNLATGTVSAIGNKVTELGSDASSVATDALTGIKSSIQPVIDAFASSAPKIIGGILLLIIGLILAGILESAAKKLLKMIKLDETSEKIGLKENLRKIGLDFSFTNAVAKFVKYSVVILTLIAAADSVQLDSLSETLQSFLAFIPKIFIALVILAGGLIGGDFSKKIAVKATEATDLSDREGFLLGTFLKSAIISIAGFMALSQILNGSDILNIVMSGFVVAAALAFGLGSKKAVEGFWDRLDKHSSK